MESIPEQQGEHVYYGGRDAEDDDDGDDGEVNDGVRGGVYDDDDDYRDDDEKRVDIFRSRGPGIEGGQVLQ